jgi:DNA-binding beta-propeller fold protein YncE
VYVIDSANFRVEKFDVSGNFLRAFGSFGTGIGQFSSPLGIAVDPFNESVYVSDYVNNRVEKFSSSGSYISQFGTPGSSNGQLSNPAGLAVDPSDLSVYVADLGNDRVQKFSFTGSYVLQFGSTAGAGDTFDGSMHGPEAVTVDAYDCSVYVSDSSNNRVQRFDLDGNCQSEFGALGAGNGQFSGPEGIGVSSTDGSTYVVDQVNNRVERFGAPPAPSCAAQSSATPEGVALVVALSCSGHARRYRRRTPPPNRTSPGAADIAHIVSELRHRLPDLVGAEPAWLPPVGRELAQT